MQAEYEPTGYVATENNVILGCINRSIGSKSHKVLVPLYSALIWLHLTVSNSGHCKKDGDKLEQEDDNKDADLLILLFSDCRNRRCKTQSESR